MESKRVSDGEPQKDLGSVGIMRKKIELETIFEASKKVFAEYDYKKATLQDIADELDVTNSNLYIYFDGKKKLYEATVNFYLRRWFDKCFAPLGGIKDPRQQLNSLMRNSVLFLTEDTGLVKILANIPDFFGNLGSTIEFRAIYNDVIGALAAILKSGQDIELIRALDSEVAAEMLFKVYFSMVIKPALRGEEVDRTVLEDIIKYGLFSTFG